MKIVHVKEVRDTMKNFASPEILVLSAMTVIFMENLIQKIILKIGLMNVLGVRSTGKPFLSLFWQ